MSIKILFFPGTNRENDMALALKDAGARKIEMVWHKETDLGNPDLIVLPGGFSHGDYLRCGAMAANSPIMQDVVKKAKAGTPVFGVCNGFQIMIEAGLLPGALLQNASLKFVCRNVNLEYQAESGVLNKGDVITVPVAHGEGNYFASQDMIKQLEDEDRIAFKYCNDNGAGDAPANPNGSVQDIAGIMSADKKILGMMPHPENATLPHQANQSARVFFKNLLETL